MLVKFLKVDRRLHADGAVAADAGVEDLDPVEDLRGELDPGPPFATVEQLGLHPGPETLHDGVIERIADGAKGLGKAGFADALAECPGGELGSVVTVYRGAFGRATRIDRHPECRVDHRCRGPAID